MAEFVLSISALYYTFIFDFPIRLLLRFVSSIKRTVLINLLAVIGCFAALLVTILCCFSCWRKYTARSIATFAAQHLPLHLPSVSFDRQSSRCTMRVYPVSSMSVAPGWASTCPHGHAAPHHHYAYTAYAEQIHQPHGPHPDVCPSCPTVGLPPPNVGPPPPNVGSPPSNVGPAASNVGQPTENVGQPPPNVCQPPSNVGPAAPNVGPARTNVGPPPVNAGPPPPIIDMRPPSVGLPPQSIDTPTLSGGSPPPPAPSPSTAIATTSMESLAQPAALHPPTAFCLDLQYPLPFSTSYYLSLFTSFRWCSSLQDEPIAYAYAPMVY